MIRKNREDSVFLLYLCPQMKRLFAAIKIHPGEAYTMQYWSLKKALKDEKIKWVDLENIHITLKFFGETPEHHIPAINAALGKASSGIPQFQLKLANTGIFGSSYNPRLIWFGIDQSNELFSLSKNIFRELENIGIVKDRQNFVPHLTVGRIKNLEDKKHFQKVIDKYRDGHIQNEEVNNFHLFESILSPQGPTYNVVESFELI
jgi:2'-5' RNA ligase